MSGTKTLLGLIAELSKMHTEMEAADLVAAAETSAQIIAKMVQKETSVEATTAVQDSMMNTHYNTTSNTKLYAADAAPEDVTEFIDDATIYVDIAENQPDTITEVKIGDMVLTKSEMVVTNDGSFKYISVGKNSYIYIHAWKIVDGVLKVAIPYLYANVDMSTGECKVVAGGIPYVVKVCEPVETELSIKSAFVTPKEGFTAEAVVNGNTVEITQGHHNQVWCLVLACGDEELTDTSLVVYRMDTNNVAAITHPETLGGQDVTYGRYELAWKDEPITEATEKTAELKLVIPGKGSININVIFHGIVEV